MRSSTTYRASRRNEAKAQATYVGARIRAFWSLLPMRELKMEKSKSKILVKALSRDIG